MDSSLDCINPVKGSFNNFLHLEEIRGKEAIKWVKAQNERSLPQLEKDPRFQEIKKQTLKTLNAQDKLPHFDIRKNWAYNFWRDKNNPKGLLRRVKTKEFLTGNSDWEIYLDLDKLAEKEGENWVYQGAERYKNRALISLSRDGKDASVIREFNMTTLEFVDDGFNLPEGKHAIEWLDENSLLVGFANEDFDTTDSGYPLKVRRWQRGTIFKNAEVIFEGQSEDVLVHPHVVRDEVDGPAKKILIHQVQDFFHDKRWVKASDGKFKELGVPLDAGVEFEKDRMYLFLRSPWDYNGQKFKTGSLIKLPAQEFIDAKKPKAHLLFESNHEKILDSFIPHKDRLFLFINEHVNQRVAELMTTTDGTYNLRTLDLPKNSSIFPVDYSQENELLFLQAENFLMPATQYLVNLKTKRLRRWAQEPHRFAPSPYQVKQYFTESKDGTQIPYYVVSKKNINFDGSHPTILTAYGGFEVSNRPYYSPSIAYGWLKQGGVYVSANIRGGGEYGPKWHKAAIKEKRQKAYDDFHAVAKDLFNKGITTEKHLGIVGRSNGGLLAGVAVTQQPELYQAAAIQVPLLDMLRYHKLPPGASWVGEYGNPEEEKIREAIQAYSPYQNLKSDKEYPEVFLMTSTADDRVHPGHARRMAAKMACYGHPFLYYENTEGGHGGAADFEQQAYWTALEYTYFLRKL